MACLIRLPGGKKNASGYNKAGPYYVKLWLPRFKKHKLIPCKTRNRKEAERILKQIREQEALVKARLQDDIEVAINHRLGIDPTLSLREASKTYLVQVVKRIAETTVQSYALALKDLENALGRTTRITELNKKDYGTLLNYLTDRYNATTVNIRLRGVRAFLHWLVESGYLEKMPFKVKMVKLPNTLPKFLTPSEVEAIYAKVEDPVLMSIFRVYEGTGMRLSELKNSVLEGKFLRVTGKGNKERIIPIPETLLHDYHIAKQAHYRPDRITKAFTEARRKAGIEDNKTLHALRHTYALRMLIELRDVHLVQKLLGHSSVVVTEIYLKFPRPYLEEIFQSRMQHKPIHAAA